MRIITLDSFVYNEIYILRRLLEWPDIYVHIRKPNLAEVDFVRYLSAFTLCERRRLVPHQHHAVARDHGVERIHLSTRLRKGYNGLLPNNCYSSTSTHSWDEFNKLPPIFSAAFVGPVFPSISKKGYGISKQIPCSGRTNFATLAIALGGIQASSIADLRHADFDDIALCGALWQANAPLLEAKRCYAQLPLSNQPLRNDPYEKLQ
ncbi:thiamine phosphate synthase [Sphingobacterium suaedae]|uniref:Thiamine phosphate synthase n=1 Tax=Sphingobacterium suaedae TaxID=1686402 RepID=A0ABW5KEJ0_9SPHI